MRNFVLFHLKDVIGQITKSHLKIVDFSSSYPLTIKISFTHRLKLTKL